MTLDEYTDSELVEYHLEVKYNAYLNSRYDQDETFALSSGDLLIEIEGELEKRGLL